MGRSRAVPPHNAFSPSGHTVGRICADSSIEARIGEQIVPLDSGCWVHISDTEYPIVRISEQGKPVKLHRWVYETLVGPVAPDHQLHHVCMNTKCVNPQHLEPLTASQHVRLHRAANGR
jgi:hypothetical protein